MASSGVFDNEYTPPATTASVAKITRNRLSIDHSMSLVSMVGGLLQIDLGSRGHGMPCPYVSGLSPSNWLMAAFRLLSESIRNWDEVTITSPALRPVRISW